MAWVTPYTFTAGEQLTAAKMNEQIRDNMNALAPVGSLHWRMQAATSIETTIDGFALECNAASVLRATYGSLNTKLSALSYPFGTADGTHMTLPDLRGRVATTMAASGHADVNAIGDSDGQATVNLRTPKGTVSVTTSANNTGAEASHVHGPGAMKVTIPNTGVLTTGGYSQPVGAVGDVAVVGNSGAGGSHIHSIPGLSGSGTVPGNYLVVGVLAVKY